MDQRHAEYVEYYRARLAKYDGNPLYPHSAAAERALFDAISTAVSLDEFKEMEASGKLSLQCAIARIRDQESAYLAYYESVDETVRAQPHREILARLDSAPPADVQDLNSMVSEVLTGWNLRISEDEHLRDEFWGDWKILEDVECYEQAVVPERWYGERAESRNRELARGAQHWREHTLPNARNFFPEYQPDWDKLWEPRHRRLLPLADDVVAERIEGHQRYLGVK
jgi:hypothetical protein